MEKHIDLQTLVTEILNARTAEDWSRTLDEYGPTVFRDIHLLTGVASVETDRPEDADVLRRWLDDLQDRERPTKIEMILSNAKSEEELDHLLETHRPLITRELGMSAVREVKALCTQKPPLSPMILGPMCQHTLYMAYKISRFLGDDFLLAECLSMRSRVAGTLGNTNAAIADLRMAADLYEKLGDRLNQGRTVGVIGSYQMQIKDFIGAEESLKASLELCDPEEHGLLSPTYEELAQLAARRKDYRAAADWFTRAGESRLHQNQRERAAFDFQASIIPYLQCGDEEAAFSKAERFFELRAGLDLRDETSEMDEMVVQMISQHLARLVAKMLSGADPVTRSMTGWIDSSDDRREVVADPAYLEKARRWASLAKRGLSMTRNEREKSYIRITSAIVALRSSDPRTAVEDAELALPFFETGNDFKMYVTTVQHLVEAYRHCGHIPKALNLLNQARERIQPVSEPPVTITLLAQQAGLLVSLGEVRKAIDLLAEALNLARQGSDISYRYHQGSLNCALAGLFSHLRQIELAVAPYLESLRIAREIGSRQGEAAVLLALGTLCGRIREFSYEDLSIEHRLKLLQDIAAGSLSAHEDMNEEPSSESIDSTMRRRADQLGADLVERALEINHEIGDYESAAIALGNLSNFQKARGGPERIETLLRALGQLRERQGRTSSEAVMLANLGKAYLSVGGIAEARACLESSLGLSESVKEYEWAHDTAEELANTYLADGRPAEAVKYLCQAIDYTEAARRSLPLEDLTRVAFVRDKLRAYENLTILYAEMNRTEEAFDTVQRGKSRALLELSALGRIDPAVPVTPQLASLLEEEEKLLAQIQLHLNDRRRSGMAGVTNRSLDDLHAELDHLYGSLENLDPQYAAIRRGKPAGFRKIRDVLAKQNHPILLVDYFTAADNLLIFLARAEWPEPKYLKMNLSPAQLSTWRAEFERQIVRYRSRGPATWTSLGSAILDPISEYLQDGDLIYVIPHGQLHGLPIHALPLQGRPLIERHPVVYLPAASFLELSQLPGKGTNQMRTCGAIGIEFEDEARFVAALFDEGESLTGELSPEQITDFCRGRDVCHFSCHGYYDALNPRASGLVVKLLATDRAPDWTLPEGAVLTTDQIVQMKFQTEMVCLSACQTGVGRTVRGDEQIGILRAFIMAGAPSVVSTLWPVEAQATCDFMETFYHQLLEIYRQTGKIEKAKALQYAQTVIMGRSDTNGAYHWAPFILSGDWT